MHTGLKEMLLDFVGRLSQQPLAQILQDFLNSTPQFLDWDSPQARGARRSVDFLDQLGRELL
jgi:hypothetical protein